MTKLDRIMALTDRVDGNLPHRFDAIRDSTVFRLDLTRDERNLIADALTVLYGVESRSSAASAGSTERVEL